MNFQASDLFHLLPMGVILLTAVSLLMYEVFAEQADRSYASGLSVLGLLLGLYLTLDMVGEPARHLFGGSGHPAPIVIDDFALVASSVMMMAGLIASLISPAYIRNARCEHGEYYALILFSVVGMMVMTMAADLMTFFLGLETMSIAVYALTGIRANDPRSAEAALKYFLMGAFATGFLLFGIALIYGATGSVALVDLDRAMRSGADPMQAFPILGLGLALVLIGFAFKIAAVPFHMWAPDVYEGAPTPITGFMAVGVKAAAFVGLLRLVMVGFSGATHVANPLWVPVLSALAVLTILMGNMMALVQQNIKRMLAYSSVSHAGYALIGVVAAAKGEESAGAALLFYLTGYTFMTLGAFGVLSFLERKEGGQEAERFGAYAGVGFRHRGLGLAMTLFMIALAGMPPTGGFFGKLYLFSSAIRAGVPGLAFVGIAGSIISIYYYLRVIVAFYMRDIPDPGPTPTASHSPQLTVGLIIAAAGVLYLGVFPNRWIEFGQAAIQSLAG